MSGEEARPGIEDELGWLVGEAWEQQERAWARDDLISFVRRLSPRYRPAWFHFLIAEKLRGVLDGTIRRIIFVLPPRHGKSTLCSRYFPAWYLGNRPDSRIIAVSYGDRLADRFGRFTRNVIKDAAYPFDIALARDSRAVDQFDIAGRAGGYFATGVGGAVTGEGADVLMLDDLVKGAREADSVAFRSALIEWYTETAYPRLEAGGAIVLIGTRWRDDDLIGYLIEQQARGGDQWEIVHLPAINAAGEALWPERFGLDELNRRKANMSARMWQAQYLGTPASDEGQIIKISQLVPYTVIPENAYRIVQSWDTAFKTSPRDDWSVCTTWALGLRGAYLIDVWRDRVEYPQLVAAAKALAEKYKPAEILIEDKGSGQSLIQSLRGETRLPVIGVPVPAGVSKQARVEQITPWIEAGRVFIPEWALWLRDYLDELTAFPLGTHDDHVDSTSQALMRMFGIDSSAGRRRSRSYAADDF